MSVSTVTSADIIDFEDVDTAYIETNLGLSGYVGVSNYQSAFWEHVTVWNRSYADNLGPTTANDIISRDKYTFNTSGFIASITTPDLIDITADILFLYSIKN